MYGVLMISAPPVAEAAADRDEVVAESSPLNVWYGNTLNVAIPLEFELIEPAKRRVVSSKFGRTLSTCGANQSIASSITA